MFCFRKDSTVWTKDFIPALLVCGIDNAGKSTMISRLCADTSDPIPTVGFVPHTVKFGNKSFKMYDVGGGERIRGIWSSYFAECYGVVYVLDSTDVRRLPETTDVFSTLTKDDYLTNKPILILANKQDTNGALNQEQIKEKLSISGENIMVTECSAIQQSLDKNIKNGLIWILKYITDNFDELSHKVNTDLTAIDEKRKKEKAERSERIRIAREEREKSEQTFEKQKTDDDSDEDDMVCSPFKPLKEAFMTEGPAITEIVSSPEPGKKTKNKNRKKKRKTNKITPMNSNEGSNQSLCSNGSSEVSPEKKLAPISFKSGLPTIAPEIATLQRSSLPPIQSSLPLASPGSNIQQTKLSDLIHDQDNSLPPKLDNSVHIPGIFQNKYVDVNEISGKPTLKMNSLHTIKIDRSKFVEHIELTS